MRTNNAAKYPVLTGFLPAIIIWDEIIEYTVALHRVSYTGVLPVPFAGENVNNAAVIR
jgi:hypothetical protein